MSAQQLIQIPVAKLKPDPANVRAAIDKAELGLLADSIKARGVLVPLSVRKDGKGYTIVMGHRRHAAAKVAKLKTVPCIVVEASDAVERSIDQALENTARADLGPMDLARWLHRLKTAEKLSPNEIAARLAKAGFKAMTRSRVDDLIRLTELPAWAQEMVDAGQVEASHVGPLLKILDLPKALAAAKKDLEHRIRWAGKAVARDVDGAVRSAMDEIAAASLTRTNEWDSSAVRFDWRKRCKGCEHLVAFGGGAWCMDKKLFEEHQAEAKAAGLRPGGRPPEKPRGEDGRIQSEEQHREEKAEQRERSLGEKARDYLHSYLVRQLAVAVEESIQLQQALVLWAALNKPGSHGTRGPVLTDLEAPEHDILSLESLTASEEAHADARRAAAVTHLLALPWRETHALARQLWGNDLHIVWTLERPFLDLFRKAELVHLATTHQCDLPEGRRSWEAMKGDELKDSLLAQHEKLLRPAILADLYQGEVEAPRKSWQGWDDGLDEEGAEVDDDEQEAA